MNAAGSPVTGNKRLREAGEGLALLAEQALPARVAGARASSSNHVVTEQKRRDRINKGFDELRTLIQVEVKLDKAAFLSAVVQYIKQVQGVLGDLLVGTGAEALSDERKWQIRMLLPRDTLKALAQAVPGQAAVPAPAPAVPAPAALPAFAPAPTVAPAAGAAAAPAVPAVSAPACALFGSLLPEQAQHAQTLFQALQLQQAIQISQMLTQAAAAQQAQPAQAAAHTAQAAAAACAGAHAADPEQIPNPAPDSEAPAPKARKGALGVKVRRHTTAAKVAPAATPSPGAPSQGRPEAAPLQGE